jgi:hypothetical protein
MKRNYIAPEFKYTNVYGTYNMSEKSSFFGSKMLDIEDSIDIDTKNLVWYQNTNNEQIDFIVESSMTSNSLSSLDEKQNNHTISIDDSQSDIDKNNLTKWIVSIDINKLLSNYLFGILKQNRTFEGIKNDMTISGNVDYAIKDYISKNILNRYELNKIDFYISYISINSNNRLKWSVSLQENIISNNNLMTKYKSNLNRNNLIINFNQDKICQEYTFDYYFSLRFSKI